MPISVMEAREFARRREEVSSEKARTVGEIRRVIRDLSETYTNLWNTLTETAGRIKEEKRELELALIEEAEREGRVVKISTKRSYLENLPDDLEDWWDSLTEEGRKEAREALAKRS